MSHLARIAALLALAGTVLAAGGPAAAAPQSAGYSWARPAMRALAADGVWRLPDDPARVAARRDLARALQVLLPDGAEAGALPADVAATDADAGAIAAVVAAGWIPAAGGFRPDAPVTGRVASVAVLRALGLGPEMRGLGRLATADGRRLRVPPGFAAAVLTRELGMRRNHPAAHESLERSDADPMALADLLAMVATARGLAPRRRAALAPYRTITLPVMTDAQRTVVEAALAQTGMPYVWGGDWPTPASPWGPQARGGFDCSGLVWMAFKGAPASAAIGAGADLRGRTADDMAWERVDARVAPAAAQPGDLIFFGARGTRTRRGAVEHVGIALGNGWMIHSSGSRAGVSVSSLARYWPSGIARARRPGVFGTPPAAGGAPDAPLPVDAYPPIPL